MGTLYLVATPIGNLEDMSPRAVRVLREARLIAAEDTRHTGVLLKHFEIPTPITSYFEHNKLHKLDTILRALADGDVALVSDAGSPAVNDPGYELVQAALAAGFDVRPVPGPSAPIAALTVSGLPTDRFVFEGFLPAKTQARRERLHGLKQEPRTLIFYEAPHRLGEVLQDMSATLGADRRALIARELTKLHESAYRGTLAELIAREQDDANMSRGEIVIVVAGETVENAMPRDVERVLRVLLDELAPAQAAKLAARLTGARRGELYDLALRLGTKS